MIREKSWPAHVVLLAAALLAPPLAYSQQPADSGSGSDPTSGNAQGPAQTPGADSGIPAPAGTTGGLFARALNSASPLSGESGPLQWGWLSVRSVSFLQYYNEVTLEDGGATASSDLSASQLSTSIVLSHAFGASRTTQLTVQYSPSLFLSEGHVYTNALNQSAGVDTAFQLTPRWGLQISDRFNYYGSQRYFSGLSLGVDFTQGTVAQNNFLNGPGRVIYDSVGATFTYLWSPVTTVSFTPTVGYQNSDGAMNGGQNLSALYGGGQVVVSHALSASQTVGVTYLGQYGTYSNTSTTAGPQSNSLLQDVYVTYGKQIGATLRLNFGLGLTDNTGIDSQRGFAASVGVTKSLKRMDFALNYYRGHQFNGYITSGSSDRVDLINTIRWSRRFMTTSSVAYFRTADTSTPGPFGYYATEQFNYGLTRSLSLTGSVAYTKQSGDGVYIENGHTRLATIGVTWTPALPTQN